jgi:hypothetical protein
MCGALLCGRQHLTGQVNPFLFFWIHRQLKFVFGADWFAGLSSKFLAVRTARLLVLAGTDRLDKELMIGQMQGKFQMEVVPGVGHILHEVISCFGNCRAPP